MLGELLVSVVGELLAELFGGGLRQMLDQRQLVRELGEAAARAETRFLADYRRRDPELVAHLAEGGGLAAAPGVREALRLLMTRPHDRPDEAQEALSGSLIERLPPGVDRARLDMAVANLLTCLGDEVLSIPRLQPLLSLLFQRASADQLGRLALQIESLPERIALTAGASPASPAGWPSIALPPPEPRHNLPRPDYGAFVGREEDLAWLARHLDDPAGPAVLGLMGVGGLGKSALAIAAGDRYRERYAALPLEQRFEAIVWVSAKETALTADGAAAAAPAGLIFRTLGDVYAAIAQVFELPAIVGAAPAEQDRLVQQALAGRRTLLIVDNFESVADNQVSAFLRSLPAGTRALVTSRVSLGGIGLSRELGALADADARALLAAEVEARGVRLRPDEAEQLLALVGGLPLALKLSLARLADGEPFTATLRWLRNARGDLPEYCVAGQAQLARRSDPVAWRLLLAIALFEQRAGAHPAALRQITASAEEARDAGLARLRRLGLVSFSRDGRVWMLPVVQRYALAALERDRESPALLRGWLAWVLEFVRTRARLLDFQIAEAPAVLAEYPALRLAIDWCRRKGHYAELQALVEGSWFLAELLGRLEELEAMVRVAHEVAVARADVRGRAFALRQLAWVRRLREEPVAATEALLSEAEQLAAEAGDTDLLADIWFVLADTRAQQGDLEGAERYARRMAEQEGDQRVLALGAYRMAKVALRREGPEAALAWLDQAEVAARDLGWRRQVAWTGYRRGVTLTVAGRYAEAEAALAKCLAEAQAWGEERFMAYALHRLVAVYALTGRHELAQATARDVRERFARLGIPRREFAGLVAQLGAEDRLLAALLEEQEGEFPDKA